MSNQTSTILVIALIAVTIFAVLGIKGCIDKKRPQPISPTQQTIDSVDKHAVESKRILDSLTAIQTRIEHEKDSLQRVAERSTTALNIRTLKLNALSKEYTLYRQYADTTNALAACDSMANQIVSLTHEVEQSTQDNRNLQNSYDSLLGTTSLIIGRLEFDKSFLTEKFEQVTGNCKQLESEKAILEKKNKRRISVGSGFGGTLIGGKPRAVIEIVSVHYSWFKL